MSSDELVSVDWTQLSKELISLKIEISKTEIQRKRKEKLSANENTSYQNVWNVVKCSAYSIKCIC